MVTEFNILRLAAMPVGGMVSKPKFQEAVLFSWTGNWIVGLLATNPCDAATSPETFIEWQNLLSLNTIYNLLEAKSIPVLGGGAAAAYAGVTAKYFHGKWYNYLTNISKKCCWYYNCEQFFCMIHIMTRLQTL